jgi:hypothetical protein
MLEGLLEDGDGGAAMRASVLRLLWAAVLALVAEWRGGGCSLSVRSEARDGVIEDSEKRLPI